MKRIRSVLMTSLVLLAIVATTALPAAAQGFGPSIACNPGTFDDCTESVALGSSKESFACEGKARDTASCTNQRTSEVSPHCVYLGHEPAEDRDMYLCGPEPENP